MTVISHTFRAGSDLTRRIIKAERATGASKSTIIRLCVARSISAITNQIINERKKAEVEL